MTTSKMMTEAEKFLMNLRSALACQDSEFLQRANSILDWPLPKKTESEAQFWEGLELLVILEDRLKRLQYEWIAAAPSKCGSPIS